MKQNSKLTLFSTALFISIISSCTVAPIRTSTTGKSLGQDNHQLSASIFPVFGAVYEYGATQNLDLGIGIENQVGYVGQFFAKYSFYNQPDGGFSHAALLGVSKGFSFAESKSIYSGLITSYLHKWFEPFVGVRYNRVSWKFSELNSGERDDLIFIPSQADTFYYWQADLGINFIADKFKTTIAYHMWYFDGGENDGFPSISFAYAF
jgi:hypothetical protein